MDPGDLHGTTPLQAKAHAETTWASPGHILPFACNNKWCGSANVAY